MKQICELNFSNSFVASLPGDQTGGAASRLTPLVSYSLVKPEFAAKPEMLSWSREAAELIDLADIDEKDQDLARVFSGNLLCPQMQPFAARYGGHQFGHWAGQLGDGRAITLGEVLNARGQRWEIQLKGAGRTPYSRRADGRAVLRSSLREYVCSEAMFFLGVPTTRALCCVLTGDDVVRDMFYDGHPEAEPGAITTRMAPSFVRFGHFEIYAANEEWDLLRTFLHYVMNTHFPQHTHQGTYDYLGWFREVLRSTAMLMVDWLRVGFVHGVMNTDNMSILGLTVDYGPYGWQDVYDPDWTPNTTDRERRRYRFGAQASVALWNLQRLAEAIEPIVGQEGALIDVLDSYQEILVEEYHLMMSRKLGLTGTLNRERKKLIGDLGTVLCATEIDMTLFFRLLGKTSIQQASGLEAEEVLAEISAAFYSPVIADSVRVQAKDWLGRYQQTLRGNSGSVVDRVSLMNRSNPCVIPRNYLLQECLDDLSQGNQTSLQNLLQAIRTPYDHNAVTERYFRKRPEWAKTKPGCSALSCSS